MVMITLIFSLRVLEEANAASEKKFLVQSDE